MEIYKVIIDNNGVVRWFDQRGNLHREGGFPAVEFPDGSKRYYEHGKRHRIDGPAVLNSDGTNQWWIDDKQLSEEKFDDRNKKGMKPFNKYYEEVGLNNIKVVEKQRKYRAYKNGECKEFDSRKEAKNFSFLIEEFISNEEEYNAYIKKHKELSNLAIENWYKDLRKVHSDVSDELFSICYEHCLTRYSFDELADHLYGVIKSVKSILAIDKNK